VLSPQIVDVLESGYSKDLLESGVELPGVGYTGQEFVLKIRARVLVNERPSDKDSYILFTNDATISDLGSRVNSLFGVKFDETGSLKNRKLTAVKQYNTFVGLRL